MSPTRWICLGSICGLLVLAGTMRADSGPTNQEFQPDWQTPPGKELSPDQVQELLRHLQKNMTGLSSLRTRFIQVNDLQILEHPVITRGQFLFIPPFQVRFDIEQPYQSVILVNDQKLARYEKMGDDWHKLRPVSQEALIVVMKQTAGWLSGRYDLSDDAPFALTATAGQITTIVLTPRIDAIKKNIDRIELRWNADRTQLAELLIFQSNGDRTLIRFLDEIRNATYPAQLFDTSADQPASPPSYPIRQSETDDSRSSGVSR